MKKLLHLMGMLLLCCSVHSQNLVLDSLFGVNGRLVLDFDTQDEPTKLLLQNDGQILVAGYANGPNLEIYSALSRFNSCGILDSSFGTNGMLKHSYDFRNTPYDMIIQADGKIICAGVSASSNAGSGHIPFVSRYNSNGTVDPGFGTGGYMPQRFDGISSGGFYSVLLYPDQRILAIGRSTGNINGGVNGFGAMRFKSNGSLDTAFDTDGIARYTTTHGSVGEVSGHILSTTNIILAFSVTSGPNYYNYMSAASMDSSGSQNLTFGTSGLFMDTMAVLGRTYTTVQSDDKTILVSSGLNNITLHAVRLTKDGQLDNTFGSSGRFSYTLPTSTTAEVKGVRMVKNNKILIYGRYTSNGGYPFLLRLNSNGTVDMSFGNGGFISTSVMSPNQILKDVIELSTGQFIGAATTTSDFLMFRYSRSSNVPYITFNNGTLYTTGGNSFQWYFNGSIINGAVSNSHNPSQNGNYTVMVSDSGGCKFLSDTFAVSNAGFASFAADDEQFTYTNPVSNELSISISSGVIKSIAIYDTKGREILKQNINATHYPCPVNNIAKGFYFLRINTNKNSYMKKIIIIGSGN